MVSMAVFAPVNRQVQTDLLALKNKINDMIYNHTLRNDAVNLR